MNLMEPLLQEKYDSLKRIIGQARSATVAFSGGVDSTFLLKVCVDLLGDRALAVTARPETFPARELGEAKNLARQVGGKHIIIDSKELELPGFSDNPPQRCFLCKTELFSKINEIASQRGIHWVFDGSNADDPDIFSFNRSGQLKVSKTLSCFPFLSCTLIYSVLIDGDLSNKEEGSLGLSPCLGNKATFLPSRPVKKYQPPVFRLCQASPVTCFPLSLIPACKIS